MKLVLFFRCVTVLLLMTPLAPCFSSPMLSRRSKERSRSSEQGSERSPEGSRSPEKTRSLLRFLRNPWSSQERKTTSIEASQRSTSAPGQVALVFSPEALALRASMDLPFETFRRATSTPASEGASLQDLRNPYKHRSAAASTGINEEPIPPPGINNEDNLVRVTRVYSDPEHLSHRTTSTSLASRHFPKMPLNTLPLLRILPLAADSEEQPLKLLVLQLEPEGPKTFEPLLLNAIEDFNGIAFDEATKPYFTDAYFIGLCTACVFSERSESVKAIELDHLPQFTDEVFSRLFLFKHLRKINLYQANISLNALAILCERLPGITHLNLAQVHCALAGKASEKTRPLVFLGILIQNLKSLEELDMSHVKDLDFLQNSEDRLTFVQEINKRLKLLLAIKTLKRAALCGWPLDGQALGKILTRFQGFSLSAGPLCWDFKPSRTPQERGGSLAYLCLEQLKTPDETPWGSFEDIQQLHSLLPKLIVLRLSGTPLFAPQEQQCLNALGLHVYFNQADAPQDPYATWDREGHVLGF